GPAAGQREPLLAIVGERGSGIGAGAQAQAATIEDQVQPAAIDAGSADLALAGGAAEPVVAGMAAGKQLQALATVQETQQALAGMAQAPAVDDRPGWMRVGTGTGGGAGDGLVVQQGGDCGRVQQVGRLVILRWQYGVQVP